MEGFKKGETVAAKDYAKALNVDAKSLRAAMRRMTDEQPGSGGRWAIEIGSDFETALRTRMTAKHNRATVTATLKAK